MAAREVMVSTQQNTTDPTSCFGLKRLGTVVMSSVGSKCQHASATASTLIGLFEKSRGTGGRMATRRTANGFEFDHGAQYFTAVNEQFRQHLEDWHRRGIVAAWQGRLVQIENGKLAEKPATDPRYVAVPSMSAISRDLADDLTIQFNCRIDQLNRMSGQWRLSDILGSDCGRFDAVIVALPPQQAASLLDPFASLGTHCRSVPMTECWTVMAAFDRRINLPADAAFLNQFALAWVARNSSKPGRNPYPDCWVLQANRTWSRANFELPRESVIDTLTAEFFAQLGVDPVVARHVDAHRWRYAIKKQPLGTECLFDDNFRIGACGDWGRGRGVEDAFLSGTTIAGRVLSALNVVPKSDDRSLQV